MVGVTVNVVALTAADDAVVKIEENAETAFVIFGIEGSEAVVTSVDIAVVEAKVDVEEIVDAETAAVVVGELFGVETETVVVEAAVAAELEVLGDDEKATAEAAAFALSLA